MTLLTQVNVQLELRDTLRETVGLLAASKPVDWNSVLNRLEQTRNAALAEVETNPGLLTCVVSVANLLLDCVRGIVDPPALLPALMKHLEPGSGWNNAFAALYRQGERVELENEHANGFTAVRWETFTRHLASLLGFSRDARELEKLWEKLKDEQPVPTAEVQLMDPSWADSAWVADEDKANGRMLVTADPTRDVYDALGLNWSGRFLDFPDPDGRSGLVRALLLSCPLHVRKRSARTLHCPTAVDGWGNLLFVPRRPTGKAWPHHGSYTARPDSDAESLPEAIHGHVTASNTEVTLRRLENIQVGSRAAECGDLVTQRALSRLRAAVMP